jgi:nucleoside-diphosphate-sugar epimerase
LYGNPKTLPVSETAPLSVTNPYALSKKLSEEACKFYSDSFNLRITIFRPFNVYGPGQNESFLIPSIICQIESGNAIRVRDLEPKRDYLYVDDVVQGILKSVYCQSRFSIMNLGSGESHSVEDIIRIIQQLMKTNLPVYSSQERRKDEMMDTVADIREARAQLGWAPHWTLARGLEQVLKRYRGFDE